MDLSDKWTLEETSVFPLRFITWLRNTFDLFSLILFFIMDPSRDQPDYSDSSSSTGCISELISSGLDQTESVSLPPLPFSLQAQLESPDKNHNQNQAMSMKELDSKLNNLRRENFDLKLRLFYERQNKGPSRPGLIIFYF